MKRVIKHMLIPMALLLPFWLTIGRTLVGAGGWLTLLYIIYVAPALFIILLIISILIRTRPDVMQSGQVSSTEAITLSILYFLIFLHGFFVLDAGDTPESINSVAINLLGRNFLSISRMLGETFKYLSLLLLAFSFVFALVKRFSLHTR